MRKILSVLLSLTILMGCGAILAVPTFADNGESTPETVTEICEHTYGGWTDAGQSHTQSCTKCGQTNSQPHVFMGGTVTQQPTCNAQGKQIVSCSVCGTSREEILPPTGNHTLTNLTSTGDSSHAGICSVCGIGITVAHTWGAAEVLSEATCLGPGETKYTCTGCHQTRTEVAPMLTTHRWTLWQRVDDTIHKRYCPDCQIQETGDHSYENVWTADSSSHFHICPACGDQEGVEPHVPGPVSVGSPQVCTVCLYILSTAADHIHDYDSRWTTDEKGHWYACKLCPEKGTYAAHDFRNDCDPDCSFCGYRREADHDYGEEWVTDGENHYHECSGCGDIQDKAAHEPGDDGKACEICGYQLVEDQEETEPQATTPTTQTVPKKKKRFPVWGALVIAGVAAALIPVLAYFTREPD